MQPSLIDELKNSLKSSDLVTPSSENYDKAIQRWNAAIEKKAGAVIFVNCVEDIVAALLFSQTHSIDLAVRSGGHFSGDANSSDRGIVIDLTNFCEVTVDPDAKTVKVQSGAKWPAIDKAAAQHGLATVAGSSSQPGVAGVTLGGGYGWLTGAHGLALDNIMSTRVVLADGSVVKTSETENPDLFWALRGAGPNFGIVAEFVFRLHDQRANVWAGALGFPLPLADRVFQFASSAVSKSKGEAGMLVILCAPPPAFNPVIVASIFYNGSPDEAKAFFGPLYEIGPIFDATREVPYSTLNTVNDQPTRPGTRRRIHGALFATPLKPGIFQGIIEEYQAFIDKSPPGVSSELIWDFHSISRVLEIPQSATSFPNRGNHYNIMVTGGWPDKALDDHCTEWVLRASGKLRELYEESKPEGSVEGTGYYTNYDNNHTEAAKVFGLNYARLVELKAIYDPKNVFNKWYPL
ncbi:hypothetical protein AJ80_01273 [Polytolypa hystricis UAMH7299]|uniref:FAD-binding PCMH-type domain-containing protein n=1 Tax=Polytolypa hystricis (strain UAMH7299) TaxID=1447883 RepID=A0A2B7YZG9_POLH7|nr:hypothetical protein AJ80_01273 [Polytolypa hystricis UAMH7299]